MISKFSKFILAIDTKKLSAILPVNNFIAGEGKLFGTVTQGRILNLPSLREINLENLKYFNPKDRINFSVSPKYSEVLGPASMVRSGLKIGIGVENTKFFTKEESERIIKRSDTELDFEKIRRDYYPESPSRLTSFFIAEDTRENRNYLNKNTSILLSVKPFNIGRLERYDMHLVDKYYNTKDDNLIHKYWRGEKTEQPFWEYLLEGDLCTDPNAPEFNLLKIIFKKII